MAEGNRPIYHIHAPSVHIDSHGDFHVHESVIGNISVQPVRSENRGDLENQAVVPDSSAIIVEPDSNFESIPRSSSSRAEPENDEETIKLTNSITMFATNPLCHGTRVYRGRQMLVGKFGRDIAIKILPRNERSEQEAGRLVSVEHPNIVKVLEAGRCPSTIPEIFIAMELCSKNLQDYVNENKLKPFEFDKSFSYSKQLVVAIAFIHKSEIVHRDLKPGNILISMCGNQIKVADLGLSRGVATGRTAVTVTNITSGTEGFKAPETYGNLSRYAYSADIFPLGICVYYIFSIGKHPFGPKPHRWVGNIEDNVKRDLSGISQFKAPNSSKRSPLISLLKRMLEHKPARRPTAEEILNDDFFIENVQASVTSQVKAMTRSPELRNKDQIVPLDGAAEGSDINDHNKIFNLKKLKKIFVNTTKTISVNAESDEANTVTKTDETITENHKDLIVLFDWNADCLRSYDPATDEVTKFHDEKFKHLANFSAVSTDSYIYVLCGNKSVHRLNFRDKNSKWERVQDMIDDHGWWPPVVSLSGSLFVIGGSTGISTGSGLRRAIGTRIVEKFDPTANRWLELKEKPKEVKDATLVSLNDSIFCIGGGDMLGQFNSFCRLTPSSSEWVNLVPMKHARALCGAVAVQQRIFVMGGGVDVVECYDVSSGLWTCSNISGKIDLPYRGVAHHIDGSIFVIGWYGRSNKVRKYDIEDDRWCKVEFTGVQEFGIRTSVSIKQIFPVL